MKIEVSYFKQMVLHNNVSGVKQHTKVYASTSVACQNVVDFPHLKDILNPTKMLLEYHYFDICLIYIFNFLICIYKILFRIY